MYSIFIVVIIWLLWVLYLEKQKSNENEVGSDYYSERNTELGFDNKKLEDEIKLKEEIINSQTKQLVELEKKNKRLKSKVDRIKRQNELLKDLIKTHVPFLLPDTKKE